MTGDVSSCPICGAPGEPLLALLAQPIYQHPVPEDVQIPLPHDIDLSWVSCRECGHAWQPDFDADLLSNIYRSYYYTPASDGLGVQFRDDFLDTLARFGLAGPRRVVLEIGASDGDVLEEVQRRTGASIAYAFEPNTENAAVARQRGLTVCEEFFSEDVAARGLQAVDLLYARHVIEHIFDFDSFFAGINAICTQSAELVLETPSLDIHAALASTDPFHIEHVHVFALRSLQRLVASHGWGLQHARVTLAGNLIAAFRRGFVAEQVDGPQLGDLQRAVSETQAKLKHLFSLRHLAFWGAGSSGISLARSIGREPDVWTDGNPGKIGKKFVGSSICVVGPEVAIEQLKSSPAAAPLLVITSTFVAEILPRIRELGWSGEVYDYRGTRL